MANLLSPKSLAGISSSAFSPIAGGSFAFFVGINHLQHHLRIAAAPPAASPRHRRRRHRRQPLILARAIGGGGGMETASRASGAATVVGSSSDPTSSPAPATASLPGFSIQGIPSWVSLLFGAFLVAVPIYRRLRMIEDEADKVAETVLHAAEKAAEEAEKVAAGAAAALPDGKMKEVALEVEKIAEAVDKGAEFAEEVVEKVDDVADKIDAFIEPLIGGDGGGDVARGPPVADQK